MAASEPVKGSVKPWKGFKYREVTDLHVIKAAPAKTWRTDWREFWRETRGREQESGRAGQRPPSQIRAVPEIPGQNGSGLD